MTKSTCLHCGEDREHQARGLCTRCYQRVQDAGELERYPARLKTVEQWIELIDRSDPDLCWPWPGPMNTNGYGNASGPAHRAVYLKMVGPIPDGHQIDHACHNQAACPGGTTCPHRRCVNWVKHLRPMTAQANLLASPNTFNSVNAARTHCPHGHPYDDDNTTFRNGRRHCKRCARDRQQRNYYADLEGHRAAARDRERRKRRARGIPAKVPVVTAPDTAVV